MMNDGTARTPDKQLVKRTRHLRASTVHRAAAQDHIYYLDSITCSSNNSTYSNSTSNRAMESYYSIQNTSTRRDPLPQGPY